MIKKTAVRVTICDEEYTVRSELDPEYTRQVAAYVDQAIKRVLHAGPMVETHKAAILAALALTDELFDARKAQQEMALRLRRLTADLARLLPPQKRQSIGG
jgi:cell division protein ZapA